MKFITDTDTAIFDFLKDNQLSWRPAELEEVLQIKRHQIVRSCKKLYRAGVLNIVFTPRNRIFSVDRIENVFYPNRSVGNQYEKRSFKEI